MTYHLQRKYSINLNKSVYVCILEFHLRFVADGILDIHVVYSIIIVDNEDALYGN